MVNMVNSVRKLVGSFSSLSKCFRGFFAFVTMQWGLSSNGAKTFRLAYRQHATSRACSIFCLLFAINAALPSASLADIKVEPGTTVGVGEEVFFDGSGVTIAGAELLPNGMVEGSYEWDFGDGYDLMKGSHYYNSNFGGTSTTHFYMRPGTYTVTLNVTDSNSNNKIETVTITVEGMQPKLPPRPAIKPILELKFENNLDDTSPNGLTAQWKNGQGTFVRGIQGQAADLTNGTYIEVLDPAGILSGMAELTISMWAKKKEADVIGYLLDKNNAYSVRIKKDWQAHLSKEIYGYVTTESSSTVVLKRNDELVNKMWHHYAITYNGSQVRLFVDGIEFIEAGYAPKDLSGKIHISADNLLIGKKFDAPEIFEGYIDEVKIYDKALTAKEIGVGFELWHANFHGHTAQYIYAQVPSVFTNDPTNKIKATITGDTGYLKVLLNKDNLQSEEKFLLNNSELPAGNYVLTVQILDSGNNLLDELTEKFEKPYDGIPRVGIDENNAIRVNGELFFPVVPWLENHFEFLANRYINAFNGQHEYDLTAWKNFLDKAEQVDLKTSGPGYWEGLARQKSDPSSLTECVSDTKDHNAMLMWMWGDEPMLNGVCSPLLRSWAYLCHKNDPQHLVDTNYAGHMWSALDVYFKLRKGHNYLYNANYFGGKRTHITDVMGFSFYPGAEAYWTAAGLVSIINRMREENHDLKPILSYVLVNKWDEFTPTPEQVRMNTWISVVHGAKGIKWYHTGVSPENYGAMAEFLDHITKLTPIVLGPESNRSVQDNANESGNRVDTMIREDGENIWIFAVRLTEVGEADNISVTFTVEDLTDKTVIEPGEFSQSVAEHHGNSNLTPARQDFSFTLANTPIMPGTVQVAGQYLGPGGSTSAKYKIWLFDDGNGNLYGLPTFKWPRPAAGMEGTVNYQTGEVYANFGEVKLDWIHLEDVSILPGKDMVRTTYRPVKGDRIIPHTGNTFTDTFAPNAVHIYKITKDKIIKANQPPDVSAMLDTLTKSEGQAIDNTEIELASDPDGDSLTYTYSELTDSLPYTIGYDQAGTHTLHVDVSDGTTSAGKDITITVNNVNRAPVLGAIGKRSVYENGTLSFQVDANDPDDDTITYSAQNLPDAR